MTLLFFFLLIDIIICIFVFTPAKGPKLLAELTKVRDNWPGFGKKSIADFISWHTNAECNSFANLLLKDNDLVGRIRRNYRDNEDFVPDVLGRWLGGQGDAIACTWENMLKCMEDAGLKPHSVKIIRENLVGI